ncbi:uncharacterized protein LY89DRAFT_679873 [Mollisia scopiformis]|uniref:Protein required for cell viability n=1 Tax=Mollisia scopiformis TaxID=149040 RepID=A0A194XTN2_MOLSC|nr:uncharacterized protein LY89DRAFT_679873 [Mollisia scopiformis]KUJ23057.1 hypothetical protein LY89DRAFT_679873 [Mollisia scopiformis]
MAQYNSRRAEPPLVDKILQSGKEAFDPTLSPDARRSNAQSLLALLDGTSTLSLMPVLNLLIQPGRVPEELHAILISTLARLPLRPRGVQHTIEFVLSVHPSTSNAAGGTGRGSSISHEALNASSRLLSSPPAGMSAQEWFDGIAPQLFSLLQGEGEPGMDKAAAYIIGFGILGRKQFGAPGMPGWNAFVEPVIGSIDPLLSKANSIGPTPKDPIEFIGSRRVLVPAQELARSLSILSTLVTSHPHPSLSKRLLRPVLLPLWYLSSWEPSKEESLTAYRKPATVLLKVVLQLFPTTTELKPKGLKNGLLSSILQNLTSKGRTESGRLSWTYASDHDGIRIDEVDPKDDVQLESIDGKVNAFIELLNSIPELESDISDLFMVLCRNWFATNANSSKPLIFMQMQPEDSLKDVQDRLVEAKLIQQMISKCPNKLVGDSIQVLELINQVFSDFLSADPGKENEAGVSLSLLNIVLTAPSFRPNTEVDALMDSIKVSLDKIGKMTQLEISATARNLLLFLTYRNSMEDPGTEPLSTPTSRQVEDRKTYSLGMSYLTATDSPPPVRAQGLELITTLIRANSSILDIPALLVLFSSLLQDDEEYIYLKAIQSLDQLSQKHPKAVMKDLIDRYVDPTEEYDLDQRLRLGEALHHVMKSNYLALTGELSQSVCEGLLFIASRRGYRPKSERQQAKKNKLKRKQNAAAEEAWGGDVPQLDEVLEAETQADEEILSQIVGGWESKRGMEDVRIRTSALAILGSAIEANVEGVGSKIVSTALDLSIHILTLEPEPEKGILRRSAILLIMSFIRALDSASRERKKLGFGLVGQSLEDVQRILEYVEASDNDGLVKQHARDVIEGLQAWQMNILIPPQKEDTELKELAGLSITPRGLEDSTGRIRPRIEEIEER